MDCDFMNIKLLQQLLTPPDEKDNSDSEDEHLPSTGIHKFGPGNIGVPSQPATGEPSATTSSTSSSSNYKNVYEKTVDPVAASIEEWQERQEREDTNALDSRKQPYYTIAYKQTVTTQDVFLQMGNKTGATASCDRMIITVHLPDETVTIDRMQLTVDVSSIDLQSPVYRLRLPLPQPIDPDAGSAQYDPDLRRLTLSLKMVRDYDFVNF